MDKSLSGLASARGIWRMILWGTLALLLLTPALAMRFAGQVDWSGADFVIMGALLAALGLGVELAVRLLRTWSARIMAIAAALAVFVAIWAELAVGVFGTPFAGS